MKYKLDEEEKAILDAFEKGQLKSSLDFEKKRKFYVQTAKNTLKRLKKDKVITLRINSQDLEKIQHKAEKEGIPYQTMLGSIIHKYASR
jgi:predicted DNA binding CopG/RHH family protein